MTSLSWMLYTAEQMRLRGSGQYNSAKWEPISAEPPAKPVKRGSIVSDLIARGAFGGEK